MEIIRIHQDVTNGGQLTDTVFDTIRRAITDLQELDDSAIEIIKNPSTMLNNNPPQHFNFFPETFIEDSNVPRLEVVVKGNFNSVRVILNQILHTSANSEQ